MITVANRQGILIYTINQQNIVTTLPQLQIGQQVKDDIANAVNAGKVVTVSKTNINFNGWNGCGYIITNPETGAGAYMISGGLSGAAVFITGLIFMSWSPLIVMLTGIALLSPLGIFLAVLTGLGAGMALSQVWNPSSDSRTIINYTVQQVIEGIFTEGLWALAPLFGFGGLLALAVLYIISNLLPYNIPTAFNTKKTIILA